MKSAKRLKAFITDIFTGGIDPRSDIEIIRKMIVLHAMSIIGIVNLIPYSIIAYSKDNWLIAGLDSFAALFFIVALIYLRKTGNYISISRIGLIFTGLLFLFLFAVGGVNHTGHLWFFSFPLIATFLLGSKEGAITSGLVLTPAIILLVLNLDIWPLASYSNDFKIRFIPAFLVIAAYAYLFENIREKAQQKLHAKNVELHLNIIELQATHAHLQKAQEDLEQRVEERTAELRQSNEQLRAEVHERHKSEQERERLEVQLIQAKKMEAIGSLASGVAHDLNNILVGLVSYPELLLLDLPKNDPLRNPILTIQKSGEKAAAIVQDLLTMARRGVAPKDIVNLNHVVAEYLKSPEFGLLKATHSNIRTEINLAPSLLNISGAVIHLFKTLMNLVANAYESMPAGGTLAITTENLYVDQRLQGYEDITEGDYATLIVEDTGIGIATHDLDRIFEPFYSKKVMGRSGTGLGLAVVWNTVKDHDGFIHVQSVEGRGSAFKLFFPITRQEVITVKASSNMTDYIGHGESILVIDDVQEQREIATRILKKLGYSAVAAASGEEAIAFLKTRSADLLVIDMIMDPGMDGLTAYQRILDFKPGQAAIIVSGFSETERVKKTQQLGAGAYIRKPYLLETLGQAVKTELAKSTRSTGRRV